MGHNGHVSAVQTDLPLFRPPTVVIPAIKIPQPDGSILFKAGKPILVEEMIGTAEAARLLGASRRWVETECSLGRFTSAHKIGVTTQSRWKLSRTEVLARQQRPPE
jgi:hypothetical protein